MILRYSNGEVIKLNQREERMTNEMQRMVNNLGFEIDITTLTTLMLQVSEQKFYTAPPADYLPVRVGQGAWSGQLTTYRSYDIGDEFETGLVNVGLQNSRTAVADTGMDALSINVYTWEKTIGWTLAELQFASKSGNWDLITSKEAARKKNWDLGVQRIAFLGANGQNDVGGNICGLLNQSGINTNTTFISGPISDLDPADLKTFVSGLINLYRANTNRTAYPTHFTIPESDYLGLVGQASAQFPVKNVLDLLLEAFKAATGNMNFKIMPSAYADSDFHTNAPTIVGKQVYALYNYDEQSLRMDVPVPYTNTLANSTNNYNFQNVGYGQVTGVLAYRPLEMLYFTYTA